MSAMPAWQTRASGGRVSDGSSGEGQQRPRSRQSCAVRPDALVPRQSTPRSSNARVLSLCGRAPSATNQRVKEVSPAATSERRLRWRCCWRSTSLRYANPLKQEKYAAASSWAELGWVCVFRDDVNDDDEATTNPVALDDRSTNICRVTCTVSI